MAVTLAAAVDYAFRSVSGAGTCTVTNFVVPSGTTLLLAAAGGWPTGGQSSITDWDTGQSFTTLHTSTPIDGGDIDFWVGGVINPTAQTKTIVSTWSASTNYGWLALWGYAGTVTSSLAAAIQLLDSVDNTNAATTFAFTTGGGTSGNCGLIVGSGLGDDWIPASNDAGFTEILEDNTGGGAGNNQDVSYYIAHLLELSGSVTPTVTGSASDENAGALFEIVAAAGGGAYNAFPAILNNYRNMGYL